MNYYNSKIINDVNYTVCIDGEFVIFGEYIDNPHVLNNELRCDLKDFIEKSGEISLHCHSLILEYFGNKELAKIMLYAQNIK